MNASNEDLTNTVLALSKTIASLVELNVTIAEIVTPLAQNLNDRQRAALLYSLQEGPALAARLRDTANRLAQS